MESRTHYKVRITIRFWSHFMGIVLILAALLTTAALANPKTLLGQTVVGLTLLIQFVTLIGMACATEFGYDFAKDSWGSIAFLAFKTLSTFSGLGICMVYGLMGGPKDTYQQYLLNRIGWPLQLYTLLTILGLVMTIIQASNEVSENEGPEHLWKRRSINRAWMRYLDSPRKIKRNKGGRPKWR